MDDAIWALAVAIIIAVITFGLNRVRNTRETYHQATGSAASTLAAVRASGIEAEAAYLRKDLADRILWADRMDALIADRSEGRVFAGIALGVASVTIATTLPTAEGEVGVPAGARLALGLIALAVGVASILLARGSAHALRLIGLALRRRSESISVWSVFATALVAGSGVGAVLSSWVSFLPALRWAGVGAITAMLLQFWRASLGERDAQNEVAVRLGAVADRRLLGPDGTPFAALQVRGRANPVGHVVQWVGSVTQWAGARLRARPR